MQNHKALVSIVLITCLLYLPILINPSLILDRGNDLQEFYWPIFYYVKEQILQNHTIPLWNYMFFSGTPLLSDPQSFLFYPPTIIFLILPIDYAFIASFMLHSFFAGFGAYLAARKGLGLSTYASIITSLLYIVFPKTAGFLEAGHFGPFAFFTWLPFLVLSSLKLIKVPHIGWSILFAASLAGLFFTFPTMSAPAALLAGGLLFVTGGWFWIKNRTYQTLLHLTAGITVTIGLTAVVLFPQIEWLPETTRFMLLESPDVYPKWNSKIQFVRAIYPHVLGGREFINSLDNEKWISTGIFISLLSFIGFWSLGKKLKLLITITVLGIVIIALNNASPAYSVLLSTDWYVLSRVSTRIWFVVILILIFLAGFGFEKLVKRKMYKVALILAFLALSELLFLSWLRPQMPIPPQKEYAPPQVFDFLKKDPGQFRVFCVNRCLSQRDVAKYNLETVEGYGTLYQKNYYDQFIQLSQVFWDKYTLVLPPFEIYNFREIQPYSPEIADYNVKYVISPHPLKDKNLVLKKEIENYLVYENTIVKSRARFANGKQATILEYSPNRIKIDTSQKEGNQLILAEVYNPGWRAYLNGKEETKIEETKNKLRQIEIKKDTDFVEVVYNPKSYQLGKKITLFTLAIITVYATARLLRRRQKS